VAQNVYDAAMMPPGPFAQPGRAQQATDKFMTIYEVQLAIVCCFVDNSAFLFFAAHVALSVEIFEYFYF
jgi:hypothetical protein